MNRTVLNERYSVRKRGVLKLAKFPPHIFPGANRYSLDIGPLGASFDGRGEHGRGEHSANTVIYLGCRVTIVIPRGFQRSNRFPDERKWAPYIRIDDDTTEI